LKLLHHFFLIYTCCFFYTSFIGQTKEAVLRLHHEFTQVLFTDFNTATKKASLAVSYSQKLENNPLLLHSYTNLSEILYLKKETDSAYNYTKKAIVLALALDNKKQLAQLYNLLGSIEKRKNKYTQSLDYYEKALALANKASKEDIPKIKNNLVRLYWATGEKKQAENILQNIIQRDSISKNDLADAYNILGVLFLEQQKDSSLAFYKKAYSLVDKSNNNYLKSITSSNLGYLYIYFKEYKKSFHYLKKSEALSKQIGDNSSLHYINMYLGIYYERQGDLRNALINYKKAIEEYGSFVDDYQKANAYWTISGIHYHLENYKEAYLYLDTFLEVNEKILSLKKKKEFEKIRTEYEVEKKNTKILLLEKEKQIANINRKIISISAIFLVLSLLLLVLFYKNRIRVQKKLHVQKNKLFKSEKEKLLKEQEIKKIQGYLDGQEKEKNRISKELHDGVASELAGIQHLLFTIDEKNPKMNTVVKNISSITTSVRLLSHNLSTTYIANNTFIDLLIDLKNNYESSNQFSIILNIYPNNCFAHLKEADKHHLYRIVQELLNNTTKHANANEILISFVKHKEYLSCIIEDDGVGFTKENKTGIGLKNITERVVALNGTIQIDSKIKMGTTISIEIPTNQHG
jgi:signal transduction histidine kinase